MSTIQWTGGGPLLLNGYNASITFTQSPQVALTWQTTDPQGDPMIAGCTGTMIVAGGSPQSLQLDPPSGELDLASSGKICASGSVVVEGYQGSVAAGYPLTAAVGTASGGSLSWQASRPYTKGGGPSIALNASSQLVEAHCENTGAVPGSLLATPGQLAGTSFTWYATQPYDTGISPSLAMNDSGVIVEAHSSILGAAGKLYYNVGQWGTPITWSGGGKYDTGVYPCVAVNNQGWVVEVHSAPSAPHLYCWLGRVSGDGKSVSWLTAAHFDDGYFAGVSLDDQGNIISVHQSSAVAGSLFYNVGKIVP